MKKISFASFVLLWFFFTSFSLAQTIDQQLIKAVMGNKHHLIAKLIHEGGNPNIRNQEGSSLLLIAAGLGHYKICKILVKLKADIHTCDHGMGVSAIHRAAQSGNVKILRLLLDHGAFIDQQSAVNGHTPLIEACFYKQYIAIEFLLKQDANMELKNTLGLNPMSWAIRQKDGKIKELLEQQLVRDNQRKKKQKLIQAVKDNDYKKAQQLINNGSDVNQVAKDGNTPLLLAAKFGQTKIVKILLENGADPNKVDRLMKATPGHKAAFFGHTKILRLLIEYGLNLDAKGPYNGYTALHDAILNNYIESSSLLIRKGANVDIRGIDGKSSRDLAKQKGLTKLLVMMK